jgi:tetratricopeptide (TPR) repeat protein
LIALAVFALLSVSASLSSAATVLEVDADTQFDYAEHLYADERFLLAVIEYQRFIYLFAEDVRVEQAMYRIGMAYYTKNQFQEAIQSFLVLIQKFGEGELGIHSYLMIGECYVELGRTGSAITTLQNLIVVTDDPDVRDEANYRIGWIYLQMALWDTGRVYFEKISPENKAKYRMSKLSAELEEMGRISGKNPRLAGALSIIPGLGYVYCERYQDALISLLVNGGLIWAAYEAFDNDLVALGSVITFVEIGFYSGNIYGSVASAHKYNRVRDRRFFDHLQENLKINLSTRKTGNGLELSFLYRF